MYRRRVVVYGAHCLEQTSGNSLGTVGVNVLEKGGKRNQTIHDNVHQVVCRETKALRPLKRALNFYLEDEVKKAGQEFLNHVLTKVKA
ncbi:hypothetical protein TNCV_3625901 [Trichonephila clavipes]|nr:hypothetical protein TNCV_3625901 [Trichonephila clavipes]